MSSQVSIAATASALALAALCLHAPALEGHADRGALIEPVASAFASTTLTLPALLRR